MDTPAAHVPDATARRRNAKILAWKTAGSACVISVIVCLITWGLKDIHSGPVHELELLEERILYNIFPPTLEPNPNYHTVVYVVVVQKTTIDWLKKEIAAEAGAKKVGASAAVAAAPPKPRISEGTPRCLLGALVWTARRAGASVIYLDYDFRSPMRGDAALISALSEAADSHAGPLANFDCATPPRPVNASPGHASRILVPTFLADDKRQTCNDQKFYLEFSTILDDIKDLQSNVEFVHPMFSLSGYGIVERVCSGYWSIGSIENPPDYKSTPEFRRAAMRRAIELANPSAEDHQTPHAGDDGYFPIRWRVGREAGETLGTEDRTKVLYRKFTANEFLTGVGGSETAGTLDRSIIVIGSEHKATADHIDSPLGMIPGALAHVNFAIDLQMRNPEEATPWGQFLFELVFIVFGLGSFWGLIFYLQSHRILPDTRSFWSETITSILELIVMTGVVLSALWFAWQLSARPTLVQFIQSQRFAGLGLCVGFVVIFAVEVMRAAAALIEHLVDLYFAVSQDLSTTTTRHQAAGEPSEVVGVAGTVDSVANSPGNP